MLSRSNKKKPPSTLGRVIKTIERQAISPTGLTALRYLAPRLLPVLAPLVLSVFSLGGFIPGCQSGSNGPLPEATQKIRIGGPPGVLGNDSKDPNVQLTSATKVPPFPNSTSQPNPQGVPASGRDIVFAFWNCENFFDDIDNHRGGAGDKEYDPWLAKHPDILRLKLEKLTEAILSINNGRGPDILALCEVESIRAVQLLQAALNAKLPDPNLHYHNVVMKEMSSGRHIAPAVVTRLNVNTARTRVLGSRQRILQSHLIAMGDKELIVIASHWTSRLDDGAGQRMKYADTIYGACNAIYLSNPKADILLCGDFNDNPNDDSVLKGLRATVNPSEAQASIGALRLINLFGNWAPAYGGSLYYQGWNQFDQILVSPGMFDAQGWSVDASSTRVVNHLTKPNDKNRRPWRFGGEKEPGPRGYSDHFPVSARLIARP